MPKRTLRPRAAARARTSAIFSATSAGGSPQVRYDVVGGQLARRRRRPAEEQRRIRPLHGRKRHATAAHREMPAFEVDAFAA